MRSLRLFWFVVALAAASPARAANNYTDIWWAAGGSEPGWGINLAQNADSIFATFFIFNAFGVPVWYTALLTRTVGETFAGNVFLSSNGTWFGSPVWTPPRTTTPVGTAVFAGQTPYRGILTYTIDSVPVNKTIERTTLVPISVSGAYLGAVSARRDGCGPNPIFDLVQFIVTQSGTPGTIRIDQLATQDGSFVCRMEGVGIQYGGVIDVPNAAYTCAEGLNATAHIIGLRPTQTGFEGRWVTDFGSGCVESGNFSGVTQVP